MWVKILQISNLSVSRICPSKMWAKSTLRTEVATKISSIKAVSKRLLRIGMKGLARKTHKKKTIGSLKNRLLVISARISRAFREKYKVISTRLRARPRVNQNSRRVAHGRKERLRVVREEATIQCWSSSTRWMTSWTSRRFRETSWG